MIWSRKIKMLYGRYLSLFVCLAMMAGLAISFFPQQAGAAADPIGTLATTLNNLYGNVTVGMNTLNGVYNAAESLETNLNISDPLWSKVFGTGPDQLDVHALATKWYGGDENAAKTNVAYLLCDFAELVYFGGTGGKYDTTMLNSFWTEQHSPGSETNARTISNIVGSTALVNETDFCSYMNATISDLPNEVVALSSSDTLKNIRNGSANLNTATIDQLMNDSVAAALNNTAQKSFSQFDKIPAGANWDFGSIINNGFIYVDQAVDEGSWGEIYLMIAIPPYNPPPGPGPGPGPGPTPPPITPPTVVTTAVYDTFGLTKYDLLGSVYNVTLPAGAKLSGAFPLTFTFDPKDLSPQDHPAVYYYDSTTSKWVKVGGAVSGNTITVTTDRLGYYAVLEDGRTADEITLPPDATASWAKEAIAELFVEGMLGYPDGTFQPERNVTRAEFVVILGEALELDPITPDTPTFHDVGPAAAWYYGYVEAASKAGLIRGRGEGIFDPHAPITRQEIACIMVIADDKANEAATDAHIATGFSDDASIAAWARGAVVAAVHDGLLKGYPDKSFGPLKNATRAEVCQMLWNIIGIPIQQQNYKGSIVTK